MCFRGGSVFQFLRICFYFSAVCLQFFNKNCHLSKPFWLYQHGVRSVQFQSYSHSKSEILIWVTLYFTHLQQKERDILNVFRVKRDRSLLAVSGPKYWPRWCHKVAFFRVFQQDFTLCLYKNRFRDDPILAFSNPNIGTTIYGYWNKKYYQELGKYKSS